MNVSLVIPVYNKAKALETTLSSVVAQAAHYQEIICVNDASTDDSLLLIQKAMRGVGNFKLLDLPRNCGPFAARLAGVQSSTSEWVQLLDADDILLGDFKRIEDAIEAVDGTACSSIFFSNSHQTQSITTPFALVRHRWLDSSNLLVRRSMVCHLAESRRIQWGEDHVFSAELLTLGFISCRPGKIAIYRQEYAERSVANGDLIHRFRCAFAIHHSLRKKFPSSSLCLLMFFLARTTMAWLYKRCKRLIRGI